MTRGKIRKKNILKKLKKIGTLTGCFFLLVGTWPIEVFQTKEVVSYSVYNSSNGSWDFVNVFGHTEIMAIPPSEWTTTIKLPNHTIIIMNSLMSYTTTTVTQGSMARKIALPVVHQKVVEVYHIPLPDPPLAARLQILDEIKKIEQCLKRKTPRLKK